jgi:hypothetical protein
MWITTLRCNKKRGIADLFHKHGGGPFGARLGTAGPARYQRHRPLHGAISCPAVTASLLFLPTVSGRR